MAVLASLGHCPGPVPNTGARDCPTSYVGTALPHVADPNRKVRTTLVCYSAYAVLFSGLTRTPLWSAERITRESVVAARTLERVDDFHPDAQVPRSDRSELEDFRGSGYDRGHMTPSGDMPTPQAQDESFSLANMVAQAPYLNRYPWANVESAVRRLATRYGAVYVVTGPLFTEAELKTLNGRMAVPPSLYKAVLVPGRGVAAWIASNDNQAVFQIVSIVDLERQSGIEMFPGITPADKLRGLDLPLPGRGRRYRGSYG